MIQPTIKRLLLAVALTVAVGLAHPARAATPEPAALLAAMQRALVPTTAQFTRVHITTRSDQPGGGAKSWDALVIRARDERGPRSALAFVTPEPLKGSALLTAPHPGKSGLGLWLYSPEERRAIEVSPLEADRQFLTTRFNFEDLALTTRASKPPLLVGSERDGQRMVWKVETQPNVDRYYSRILTFIAADTQLPIKREYYDRAGQLWKVVSYGTRLIDGIATVMNIELHDVQSRDVSQWQVQAVHYEHDKFEQRVLSPGGLSALEQQVQWRQLDASDKRDGHVLPRD